MDASNVTKVEINAPAYSEVELEPGDRLGVTDGGDLVFKFSGKIVHVNCSDFILGSVVIVRYCPPYFDKEIRMRLLDTDAGKGMVYLLRLMTEQEYFEWAEHLRIFNRQWYRKKMEYGDARNMLCVKERDDTAARCLGNLRKAYEKYVAHLEDDSPDS